MYYHRFIRLKGYDYSRPGAYFVTMCTENRECHFGNIVVGAGSPRTNANNTRSNTTNSNVGNPDTNVDHQNVTNENPDVDNANIRGKPRPYVGANCRFF